MNKTAALIKRLQFTTTDCNSRLVLQEWDWILPIGNLFLLSFMPQLVKDTAKLRLSLSDGLTASIEEEE